MFLHYLFRAFFTYSDDGKTINVGATGTDGYSGLVANFSEDTRSYGFLRVQTGDDLSQRAKFVFIAFVGERVSPLKKARVSTDKAVVKEVVRDFAVELFANTVEEISEDIINAAVKKAMGADYGSSTN